MKRTPTKPPEPPKTCASCIRHSRRDNCCELTGDSRKPTDAACFEHGDGKVTAAAGKDANNSLTVSPDAKRKANTCGGDGSP